MRPLNDGIYSQGNQAVLTCNSGYVINHINYLKSAPVLCNYTPSDGSTWKIVEVGTTVNNQSAACIRGITYKINDLVCFYSIEE